MAAKKRPEVYIPPPGPTKPKRPEVYIPPPTKPKRPEVFIPKPGQTAPPPDEDDEAALKARLHALARKTRSARRREAVDAEIKEALAAGNRGTALSTIGEEIKRLSKKARELKQVLEIKQTENSMRTIVAAGQRPPECREIAVVLTRDELRKIIWAIVAYEQAMGRANDRAPTITQIDEAVGKGDLVEYLLMCGAVSNVYHHIVGGKLKRGELGPYAHIDGIFHEDWPRIEE